MPASQTGGSASAGASQSRTITPKAVSNAEKAANLIGQARMSEASKDYSQAVAYYQQATQTDPQNKEVKFFLGKAASKAGDAALSRQSLQDYLASNPSGSHAAEAKDLLNSTK